MDRGVQEVFMFITVQDCLHIWSNARNITIRTNELPRGVPEHHVVSNWESGWERCLR